MKTQTATGPRTARDAVTAALVVALLLAPLMFALQLGRVGPQPHGFEVGVVGPLVVSQTVVGRAAALPGEPVDGVVLPESADPTDAVRRGLLDATVTIDFRQPGAVLHVSSTADPDLVAEVRVLLQAISSTYGRTVTVTSVPPVHHPDTWRGTPYALVGAWVVLGVALAVGLSLRLGPTAPDVRRALVRTAAIAALSALSALGVALVAGLWAGIGVLGPTAVGAVTVAATAWLVRGAEALFGLTGLGVTASYALAAVVPLLALTDPSALPRPWPDVVPWTIAGAALDLTEHDLFFAGSGGPRPFVVLGSWAVLALLALGAARHERPVHEPVHP